MILDPKRLMLVVRDTGEGFEHAAVLDGARGPVVRRAELSSAVNQLRTRTGDVAAGGVARMYALVDRLEYNRKGNEVVLTKFRPDPAAAAG
jgi:hypothetical protein